MEEFIRRPAAAAQPLGSWDYIRRVAYRLAQVFAAATFIKLLHILRTSCHLQLAITGIAFCRTEMPPFVSVDFFSLDLC